MKLVGGDPCLDFVNTVGGRVGAPAEPTGGVRDDKLAGYADLVAFALRAGLLSEPASRALLRRAARHPRQAQAVRDRAVALREALHRMLHAFTTGRSPAPADLARVNDEIAAARREEELVAREGGLRWSWRATGSLDEPLWPIVRAAATLLTSPDLARLRRCGGDTCGWLFLDRSRNRRRQWCTMEDCGNLAKVRRFRRRHAGSPRAARGGG
jgi:predicted RNA-binding Zn ribbon-like protein